MQTPEPEGNRERNSAPPTPGARTRPQHGGAERPRGHETLGRKRGLRPQLTPGTGDLTRRGGDEWHVGRGL